MKVGIIPNGTTSYINQIPYVPIIAGTNVWTDANGNVIGTGPSLPVNLSSSTTISKCFWYVSWSII